MYSDIKSVQILLSLLKQYGVRHIVLSPGNRNVPIVHSVEEDDYFKCYLVTDERSAGFFAIGLIHRCNEPVAICSTSGTAVCNYASAVNEAFYQNLPLVVITADRNPYFLNQLEDQMIPQMSVFRDVCKAAVQLPIVKDEQDKWVCQNLINSALLEMDHHGKGPVHIDIPIENGTTSFNTKTLPCAKKINRVYTHCAEIENLAQKLKGKRIFVLYGQNGHCPDALKSSLEAFASQYNAVIAVDHLSNLKCKGAINMFCGFKMLDDAKLDALVPDIVISCGGNFISNIRPFFRNNTEKIEHWLISESGQVQDPFHCLTEIIEGDALEFFEKTTCDKNGDTGRYYKEWKAAIDSCVLKEIPYSDLMAVSKLMSRLKAGDKLHLANSSSVRLANHFELADGVEVTCNRGTNGIDGSMSSFIGEAALCNDLNYLLIGDLSFFYDMNALWNRYVGKNVRILLNNNSGAGIFHCTIGKSKISTLNMHTAAEHFYSAEGWAKSAAMKYISAKNEEELESAIQTFTGDDDVPMLLEVFTDKEKDANILRSLYGKHNNTSSLKQTIKKLLK